MKRRKCAKRRFLKQKPIEFDVERAVGRIFGKGHKQIQDDLKALERRYNIRISNMSKNKIVQGLGAANEAVLDSILSQYPN